MPCQFHVCVPFKRAFLAPSLPPSPFGAAAPAEPGALGAEVWQVAEASQGTETPFILLLGRRGEGRVCPGALSKLVAETDNKPRLLEYQPNALKYLCMLVLKQISKLLPARSSA